MNNAMDTAEQDITVELESAVGPRVLYPTDASAEEVEGEIPEGWAVSETGPVLTQGGRWSAPLVRDLVYQVTEELERLDATDAPGETGGIFAKAVDGRPDQVLLEDEAVEETLNGSRVLELLRALPDGAGFEAVWQALAEICP